MAYQKKRTNLHILAKELVWCKQPQVIRFSFVSPVVDDWTIFENRPNKGR